MLMQTFVSPAASPPPSSTTWSPGAPRPRRWWLAFGVWLALALAAAAGGLLARLPDRALPLVIWLPVIVAIVAARVSRSFRATLATLNVRAIVLAHGIRAGIGAAFLVQASHGVLPEAFGRPAGWGDIVAGALAVVVAATLRPDRPRGRRLLLAWNLFGFLDILMAFVSAQRLVLFVRDARMGAAFSHLPFSLVPLLAVPFVLASHLWLFGRLRREAAPSGRRVIDAA